MNMHEGNSSVGRVLVSRASSSSTREKRTCRRRRKKENIRQRPTGTYYVRRRLIVHSPPDRGVRNVRACVRARRRLDVDDRVPAPCVPSGHAVSVAASMHARYKLFGRCQPAAAPRAHTGRIDRGGHAKRANPSRARVSGGGPGANAPAPSRAAYVRVVAARSNPSPRPAPLARSVQTN